jgi:hypothetical protein
MQHSGPLLNFLVLLAAQVFISVYLRIMTFCHVSALIFHLALLVQNIQLADSVRWSERLFALH